MVTFVPSDFSGRIFSGYSYFPQIFFNAVQKDTPTPFLVTGYLLTFLHFYGTQYAVMVFSTPRHSAVSFTPPAIVPTIST